MARKKIDLSTSGEGSVIDMRTGKPVSKPVLPIICERIQFYRNRLGIEQKELARLVGITANAVSNWENGRSRPDVNLLPGICDALNITLYDLFSMKDPTIRYNAREQMMMESYRQLSTGHQHAVDNLIDTLTNVEITDSLPDLKQLMYFERGLAAGHGDPTEIDDEGEPVLVYASPEVNRADCIFNVIGNSMEPKFRSGQQVLVERIPNGLDLQYGEIGAFITGNETYIKVYQEDGLHSLNPDYAVMRFDDQSTSVYLIGRVVGVLDQEAAYPNEEIVKRYMAVHGEN